MKNVLFMYYIMKYFIIICFNIKYYVYLLRK